MSEAVPVPAPSPLRQVHLLFEQFKLVRVGIIVVLIDLYGSWYLLDSLRLQPARILHVGLLFILIGIAAWRCIRHRNYLLRYRHVFIGGLEPGWFVVGKDGCVKRSLVDDGVQASGEQEMVSLSDQAGRQAKLWCVADVFFYLVMVWVFCHRIKAGSFSRLSFA